MARGATVSAYVTPPLCAGARAQLARSGGRAGAFHVRTVCLSSPRPGGKLSLTAIGADARRASEDSTAIGFIEAPDPAASRFSRPILQTAGIPWITASSGATSMARLLRAIEESSSASRAAVQAALRRTRSPA